MLRKIAKSILFTVILFILLFFTAVWSAKSNAMGDSKYFLAGDMQGEKENTIDYFVMGDSSTYTSVIPLEIWNKYGYTGYVLGGSAQRLSETKQVLLDGLKTQKPKVVLLETNALFRQDIPRKAKSYLRTAFVGLYNYHDNWKFLLSPHLSEKSGNEKGYIYSSLVKRAKKRDDFNSAKLLVDIPEKNYDELKEIQEICDENGIRLVLFSTMSTRNWCRERHDNVQRLADSYGLEFIDLNMDNAVAIDWETDTQDAGDHMNYYGALKVTDRIGEYMDGWKLLEDHRKNQEYSYWDRNYRIYRLKVASSEQ